MEIMDEYNGICSDITTIINIVEMLISSLNDNIFMH